MVAVVTGGTGFIGGHLVEVLRSRGVEVRLLRRAESRRGAGMDDASTHFVDFADAEALTHSPVWRGVTHCFHLGAATRARSAAEFERHNVAPTRHIARALAARGDTPPRLVYLSSLAASGPAPAADSPRRETDEPAPVEAYGASKLAGERAVAEFADRVPVTVIRPAAVYGPRDRDFLEAFRQALAPIAVYAAPAEQRLSIVHVRDVVGAVLAAADSPAAVGRTYFVAAERSVSWRELYGAVAAAAGRSLRAVQLPAWTLAAGAALGPLFARRGTVPLVSPHKVALARPRWWTCDASRARAELGWHAAVSFDDGVRETYAWYRDAGWLPAHSGVAGSIAPR
ncbi:MAG: NAD-dependent epimerase/dehydratase family protein [Gemmatimonadetes bacterium]|nr:NAD-dependent epimerase/dehydratase family protein [Gemmatimonadota bacterium]